MKKLGLGVLGLGEGRSIISAGVHSDLWNVAALCDLNETLGRERCAEFGLPATLFTHSLDALLANPAVDVVGIYTPDHLHAEHVLRVLRAGKHVICTKPFLNDLGHAREVLEAGSASTTRPASSASSTPSRPTTTPTTAGSSARAGP
jgi:predicted dehydrogenase